MLQNRSLAPTTLELTLDYFPGTFVDRLYGAYNAFGIYRYSSPVKLPRTPVAAISSIVYTRSDGVDVTMVSTDYILKSSGDIVPSYGKFWPIDVLVPGDAIKVTYTAGYAADEVPKTTIQGMLLLIGHWYEKREAIGEIKMIGKVPFGVENLLWMDRSW